MRTIKGWSGVKELDGKKVEGNCLSHQVVLSEAKTDPKQLQQLEDWLRSYNINELFDREKGFGDFVDAIVPEEKQRMGMSPHALGGSPVYKPLHLPAVEQFAVKDIVPGETLSSSMIQTGKYLGEVFKLNEENHNFRMMSPDETYSNKLDAVFEVTNRAFVWPKKEWDRDIANDGRVIEMLSEHSLQGLMQGYVLTGRHAVFASYEAFVQIVGSMADQYAKFLMIARDISWRGDVPSLNYILTSGAWRQEHNGFSHQNPGFIDDMLQRQGCFVNVYFPADANTALCVIKRALASKKEMNIIVMEKRPSPCWRTPEEATQDVEDGISTWDFASDNDPHMVFGAVGDYLTKETLAAMTLVWEEIPNMRLRFVNIASLSALGIGSESCRVLPHEIDYYCTNEKPVLINFHGYPQTMKQVLFDYGCDAARYAIRGYEEHGSTTTPFDMQIRNRTDRYHLAMEAFTNAEEQGIITVKKKETLIKKYEKKLADHHTYIMKHGADPDEITNWSWTPHLS